MSITGSYRSFSGVQFINERHVHAPISALSTKETERVGDFFGSSRDVHLFHTATRISRVHCISYVRSLQGVRVRG